MSKMGVIIAATIQQKVTKSLRSDGIIDYLDIASAVIDAMRKLTVEMRLSGGNEGDILPRLHADI